VNSNTSAEDVKEYLIKVKQAMTAKVTNQSCWVFVQRAENTNCLLALGLTLQDLRDVILSLSYHDYSLGPVSDRDIPGQLWIFGKLVNGIEIYIKTKLVEIGDLRVVRIISFHPAGQPLQYPYNK
jgi:hypothetical protein